MLNYSKRWTKSIQNLDNLCTLKIYLINKLCGPFQCWLRDCAKLVIAWAISPLTCTTKHHCTSFDLGIWTILLYTITYLWVWPACLTARAFLHDTFFFIFDRCNLYWKELRRSEKITIKPILRSVFSFLSSYYCVIICGNYSSFSNYNFKKMSESEIIFMTMSSPLNLM